MRLTATQRELLMLMAAGSRLMWFGDAGPELSGRPLWPQKRTVRALIRAGFLRWGDYLNESQRMTGIVPVELTDEGRAAVK